MKAKLKSILKTHIATFVLITTVALIAISMFSAPAYSISANQCSVCHGSRFTQQLDVLEGNSQNNLPSNIQVGQTLTVTVVLQNKNNANRYNQLSSVTATLSSQNNHFSVSAPTYNIGSLPTGTGTATWQITGTSEGSDQLVITASAFNSHESITFADSYSPNPTITVTSSGSTSPPTSSPTPSTSPTPTPTPIVTPSPTLSPTPLPTETTSPTPTASSSNIPTELPISSSPTLTPSITSTPAISNATNHELNSTMLYIHPPLAIASYAFIFLFAIFVIKNNLKTKTVKIIGWIAWFLALLGLLTGMFWAQTAWGSYWSWDLKEILTLALFSALTAGQVAHFEKKQKATCWLAITACILVVVTGLSSFIISGLHSFA